MADGPRSDGRNILLVEDDRTWLRIARRAWDDAWCVVEAETVEAGSALLDCRIRFAAGLIDIQLPDGDGCEVIGKMHAANPRTPIAIWTAHSNGEALAVAAFLGIEYIFKGNSLRPFARRVAIDLHVDDAGTQRHIAAFVGKYNLTSRQSEIVSLVTLDRTDAEIAVTLGIAVRTVKNQGQLIADRCGLSLREIGHALRSSVRETARGGGHRLP